MASEAPQPRAGSGLKKRKRAGSRELKLMAFAFLSDEDGEEGRGGEEKDTKSNFPLPACGFSTGCHGRVASIGYRRKDTT